MNTIAPNVVIETSFQDFKGGIDPVCERVRMQPAIVE